MIQAILSLFGGPDIRPTGREAAAGFDAALLSVMSSAERRAPGPPLDRPVRDPEMARLAPELRARLERVIGRMRGEFGHDVQVVEGWRSAARQDHLFTQGRTRPGPVVTWTRDSAHEVGRAADLMVNGGYGDLEAYRTLQRVAREEGLVTLGLRDPGHVELPGLEGAATTGHGDTRMHAAGHDGSLPARVEDPAPGVARVARVATVATVATVAGVARLAPVARVARIAVPGTTSAAPKSTVAGAPDVPHEARSTPRPEAAQGSGGPPIVAAAEEPVAGRAHPRAAAIGQDPGGQAARPLDQDGQVALGGEAVEAGPTSGDLRYRAVMEHTARRPDDAPAPSSLEPAPARARSSTDPETPAAGWVGTDPTRAGSGTPKAPIAAPQPQSGPLRPGPQLQPDARPAVERAEDGSHESRQPRSAERASLAAEIVDHVRARSRTGDAGTYRDAAPSRDPSASRDSALRRGRSEIPGAPAPVDGDRQPRPTRTGPGTGETTPGAPDRSGEARARPAGGPTRTESRGLGQRAAARAAAEYKVTRRAPGAAGPRAAAEAARSTDPESTAPSDREATRPEPLTTRTMEPTAGRPTEPRIPVESGQLRAARPVEGVVAMERPDVASRVEAVDSVRARSEAQPLRRVSLRVGEGQDAARVRVDLQGDAVRAEMDTRSSRLAHQMGHELPELTRALGRQGVELEGLRVRQGERIVADIATPKVAESVRTTEPGSSGRNDETGTQRHAHEGRDRRRERNQEGNE